MNWTWSKTGSCGLWSKWREDDLSRLPTGCICGPHSVYNPWWILLHWDKNLLRITWLKDTFKISLFFLYKWRQNLSGHQSVCVHMYIYIHRYIWTHTYAYTYYIHIYIYHISYVWVQVYMCIYVWVHIYVYIHICTYIHTCVYMYIYLSYIFLG